MKILDKLTDTISIQLLSLITIFLLSWASFFNIGNGFYGDPFHQGEYLAALQLKLQGMSFYSIHGAMDWLPGLVSIKLFASSFASIGGLAKSHFSISVLNKGWSLLTIFKIIMPPQSVRSSYAFQTSTPFQTYPSKNQSYD